MWHEYGILRTALGGRGHVETFSSLGQVHMSEAVGRAGGLPLRIHSRNIRVGSHAPCEAEPTVKANASLLGASCPKPGGLPREWLCRMMHLLFPPQEQMILTSDSAEKCLPSFSLVAVISFGNWPYISWHAPQISSTHSEYETFH